MAIFFFFLSPLPFSPSICHKSYLLSIKFYRNNFWSILQTFPIILYEKCAYMASFILKTWQSYLIGVRALIIKMTEGDPRLKPEA